MSSADRRAAAVIFTAAACIQFFYMLTLPISLPIDSFDYIRIAANPFVPDANVVRTPGYPLLVAAAGVPALDSALPVVVLQLLLGAAIPVLAFYTVRDAGLAAAWTAAGLMLTFQYAYTMPLQVMTETVYLFGSVGVLCLLGIFLRRGTYGWLLACVGAIAATAEVRPSATLLYAAIPFTLAVRAIAKPHARAIKQLAVGTVIALVMIVGRGFVTERNSGNIGPFFVWHWMAPCELPDGSSCVATTNGASTARFFEVVAQLLKQHRDFYDAMASARDVRGAPAGIRPEFIDYSDASIDRLVEDLQTNTAQNNHRGPHMVLALWNYLGVNRTGELLRPVIVETLFAHPGIARELADRFLFALFIPGNMITRDDGFYMVLHDNVYWPFVPHSLSERGLLDTFPGGASLYAEWLHGLERRTGRDPAAKSGYGHVPESWTEAREALDRYGNRSAIALYLGGLLTRTTVAFVCVASLVLLPFVFASGQRLLGITVFLVSWGLILTSFFSQTTFRMILLHAPGLFVVVALGIDGVQRLGARLLSGRVRGEAT